MVTPGKVILLHLNLQYEDADASEIMPCHHKISPSSNLSPLEFGTVRRVEGHNPFPGSKAVIWEGDIGNQTPALSILLCKACCTILA